MKSKYLKQLLNTKRVVADYGDYIAVGSSYIHNLINIDKKTLKLKYQLDTFREGRKSLMNKDDNELLDIYDKLQGLIDSGEINEIINGNDEVENKLTVWTVNDGDLIETYTNEYGYPNTTHDGKLMHDNTYFKTKEEAIEKAIGGYEYSVNSATMRVNECEAELMRANERMEREVSYLNKFKELQSK